MREVTVRCPLCEVSIHREGIGWRVNSSAKGGIQTHLSGVHGLKSGSRRRMELFSKAWIERTVVR